LHKLLEHVGLENAVIKLAGREVNGFGEFRGGVPHFACLGQGDATVKIGAGIPRGALLCGIESLLRFEKTPRAQEFDPLRKLDLGWRVRLPGGGEIHHIGAEPQSHYESRNRSRHSSEVTSHPARSGW